MLFGKKLKEQNQTLIAQNGKYEKKIRVLEEKLSQKDAQISELSGKVKTLEEQNATLFKKAELVLSAEFDAENYKKQLEDSTLRAYNLQIQALKTFIARWQASLPEAKQSPDLKKKLALSNALEEIIRGNTPVLDIEQGAKLIDQLNDVIGGKNVFEDNGFDLNEVLNPTSELDLESLCKELGVMD